MDHELDDVARRHLQAAGEELGVLDPGRIGNANEVVVARQPRCLLPACRPLAQDGEKDAFDPGPGQADQQRPGLVELRK